MRAAWDPKTNFTSQDLLRLALGDSPADAARTLGITAATVRSQLVAIRRKTGAVVIALRKPDGRFDITPNPDTAVDVGDVVIAK